jgi:16S rRNA (cytosine1402-N4)-methyltransferase
MLAEIISGAKRGSGRSAKHTHPATQSFQAFRIAVNDELHAIDLALPGAFAALATGGVLATIAYHSLEDRIVKHFFKDRRQQGTLELLWDTPLRPAAAEVAANPRARSARLRAGRRLA